MANPQYKALISVLCSGMRIGEALSRKWADLEIRKEGYARVRMQASETKARYLRFSFWTRETMEWIRVYTDWLGVNSEYVFPGENPTKPLQYATVLDQIKRLFDRNGMKDNGPEIFSPHSFRTFTDGQMRKAGMDSKYVSAIIGHTNKLQSEIAYIDWNEVEKEFFEKVEPKMTWLSDSILQARIDEEKTKNANLQTLLTTALTPDQIEKLKDFLSREVRQS
jgi:integrase